MSLISAFPGGGAEIEGNALPENVEKGVTFMSANSDEVQTGTKVPQGTATPSDVVSGKTFQSAASEGLQTGTRSSGTYRVRTGSATGSTSTTPVTVGFYPTYLYVISVRGTSAYGETAMALYWNGTSYRNGSGALAISKTSSGFTYSCPDPDGTIYYIAIGT